MITEKLTNKAVSVFKTLPKGKKRANVDTLLKIIVDEKGLGSELIQAINITYKNVKTVDTSKLLKESYYQAVKFEHTYVGTEHILLALLRIIKSPEYAKVRGELLKYSVFPSNLKFLDFNKNTPVIDQFGGNLTHQALKDLDRVLIERDVYQNLVSALLLKESIGVVLVGEEGVGRQSLIDLFARKTSSFDVPVSLIGCKVIELDLLSFMTSTINKNGMEIGLLALLDELKGLGKVVVVIKNLENIFVSTPAGLSIPLAYSIFKSSFENAGIKVIFKMNVSLYERLLSDNENVLNDFTIVDVPEPLEKKTIEILSNSRYLLEDYHNIGISDEVVLYAYEKAREELPEFHFPKKGIVLLDAACTQLLLRKSKVPNSYKKMVDKSFDLLSYIDIYVEAGDFEKALNKRKELQKIEKELDKKEEYVFSAKKVLSLSVLDIDKALEKLSSGKDDDTSLKISKLSGLDDKIKKDIIGQNEAVNKTVKALIRASLGLRTKKRPLGNFLFLGPTGVGKTELAKVLSEHFYEDSSLIRLDMSDFSEKHNVARLVGAPPGYVGYGDGGELTTKIHTKPNSVVLFDEIEKAHPDVLNILLQILEEGELKDARGQTFDFSHSVVILTSNAGTDIIHKNGIGFKVGDLTHTQLEERLKNNLKKILKPELLNRFDDIIIFKQLSRQDQFEILDLLIKDVKKALKKQDISITISRSVKDLILRKGYSKEFGARSLRRVLETELLDKIAEHLLEFKERPLKLKASVVDDTIVI